MITISNSVICMNHLNLIEDIQLSDKLNIDYFHIDVMDNNYVPRFGIYPEIVENISKISSTKMDLHLMVNDPFNVIDIFAKINNIKYINFHIDGHEKDSFKIIDKIHSYNIKAGVCINLGSSFESAGKLLRHKMLDSIVFMGIHPGVLKQTARPKNLIVDIFEFNDRFGLPEFVQIDGGITFDSIPSFVNLKLVNNFVCGSSTIYKISSDRNESIKMNVKKLKSLIGR